MGIKKHLRDAYEGKKVFITGHTGFKGSWFSLWLTQLGAQVKGYALKPEENSLYESIRKGLPIESVIADIRNKEKLEKEILNFKPDFIFHFAAQALVRYSYQDPLETFEVNAMGTANLLHAVTKLRKKCSVIVVTTDKVYENKEQNYAYQEEDKLGGYDPYSASKACAEIIIQSYRLSFFNPNSIEQHKKCIASARAGNVIGGGDYSADRIIPDMVRALGKNKPLKIRNPKSVRPWQHVLDPLAGYLMLGTKMNSEPAQYSTVYNFGPDVNDKMNVEELVKATISYFGKGSYLIEKPKDNFHEAELLLLDNSKAKKELEWQPRYNAREAIEETIGWYKNASIKNSDKKTLCLNNILNYESKMDY